MQRTAVMAGRQIGGAHDRQRGGEQHVLRRGAGGELVVRGSDNALGRRLLDELDQGLDVGGIANALGHDTILRYRDVAPAGEAAERASRTKAGSKIRSAIT